MVSPIHPISRPKILTRWSISSAASLRVIISNGGSLNTNVDITIPAGDYYVSGDCQDDDLLHVISYELNTTIAALPLANREISLTLDPETHKVSFDFWGSGYTQPTSDNVKIVWTTSTQNIHIPLGFDNSTDDTSISSNNPTITGDYQHGFGWYAEEDGQLASDFAYDSEDNAIILQDVAPSGSVKTVRVGGHYTNTFQLQFLKPDNVWSNQSDYGTVPGGRLTTNKGLECWWREARKGTPFRFYRNGLIDTSRSIDIGVADASSTIYVNDANKAWTTNQHLGRVFFVPDYFASGVDATSYIASMSSARLTGANVPHGASVDYNTKTFYVFDHEYGEYVINARDSRGFNPDELRGIERYSFTVAARKKV